MRASVLAAWPEWVGQFEGLWLDDGTRFQWLGLDKLGRPVTAYGCDLASPSAMSQLTWRTGPSADAPVATYSEIANEWLRVRAMQAHAGDGAASHAFRSSAQLFYDVQSMNAWISAKLRVMEALLRKHIHTWADLPGVVQIARMRTEWADGDDAWPKLDAAITAGLWNTAWAECLPRADKLAAQTKEYRLSYDAVRALYLLADAYPGEELPDPLPDGKAPSLPPPSDANA